MNVNAVFFEEVNRRRAKVTTRAKRNHAMRSRTISRPPTGYIKVAKGQWAKDIPAVRERIEEIFRLYDIHGSVGKVVRCLAGAPDAASDSSRAASLETSDLLQNLQHPD